MCDPDNIASPSCVTLDAESCIVVTRFGEKVNLNDAYEIAHCGEGWSSPTCPLVDWATGEQVSLTDCGMPCTDSTDGSLQCGPEEDSRMCFTVDRTTCSVQGPSGTWHDLSDAYIQVSYCGTGGTEQATSIPSDSCPLEWFDSGDEVAIASDGQLCQGEGSGVLSCNDFNGASVDCYMVDRSDCSVQDTSGEWYFLLNTDYSVTTCVGSQEEEEPYEEVEEVYYWDGECAFPEQWDGLQVSVTWDDWPCWEDTSTLSCGSDILSDCFTTDASDCTVQSATGSWYGVNEEGMSTELCNYRN